MDAVSTFALSTLFAGVGAFVGVILGRSHRTRIITSRLRVCEEMLTDHDDRLTSLLSSLKTLHSRAGMRELRERRGKPSDNGGRVPDPHADPEAWKRYMRQQAALKSFKPKMEGD